MIFKQKAKLTTSKNGEAEENAYEYTFVVKPKGCDETSNVIYDKQLKIYFENPSGIIYFYEVEVTNVRLNLCQRLKKSTNFNRKLFYRYDFIRPSVNAKGQVISISNKAELKQNWAKLKTRMETDHKGNIVKEYLSNIDREFTINDSIYPAINQYLYFGLLFLNIPKSHSDDWVGKRRIEFSPYEHEKFEEITTVSSSNRKNVTYHIQGNTLENSSTYIQNYSGYAIKPVNDNLVSRIEISASFIKDDYENQWEFELYKI